MKPSFLLAPSQRFLAVLFLALMGLCASCRADEPATEFFAIETAKLTKLAPTDVALDTLSSAQLTEISLAHGWYDGGLSMKFQTTTFRIDARFTGSADLSNSGPASLGYNISASNDPTSWSLLSTQGTATKQGKQFITENWRKQPVTVVLRFLNLKK